MHTFSAEEQQAQPLFPQGLCGNQRFFQCYNAISRIHWDQVSLQTLEL